MAAASTLLHAAPAVAQLRGPMERAEVRLVADRTAYTAGETALVAVVLTIDAGWHTNSHQPTYDYLIATEAIFEPPAGWQDVERIDYPAGVTRKFSFAELPLSVYEGTAAIEAALPVPAQAAAGVHGLTATLVYQACDDRQCLPPVRAERTLDLAVGAGGRPAHPDLFGAASAPGADRGSSGPNFALVLLLGLLGGFILNAMPCVLPVLSLKVFGLVKAAGQSRQAIVAGSLATAAGILLSFWALAGAAVVAKAAGGAVGWGVQFQEPGFVAALAVIVVLFSLNLWGLFEVPLPARLARLADAGPKEGVAGHLASGLFATLMATPCSAPVLGTAVGFALAQAAPVVFATFTAVGLGMALPYLALAVSPRLAGLLPKPGAWMATFKHLMGFLMAAAGVWLLYVLSAQIAAERLAFFELALLALALCVWLGAALKRPLARRAAVLAALAVVVAAVGLIAVAPAATSRLAGESAGLIPWTPFDRAEAERLAAQGRLVFVDVTADWCFTCKVNERLVLETPAVAAAFERHDVLAMRADWTNRDDAIARFLADHGRYGIPFYLLYRPGAEAHVFSELLTKDAVLEALATAAPAQSLAERR